jgi:excisionase family DNA binding protein
MRDEPAMGADDLLTVTDAARQLGVSRATVKGWITHGHLPAVRINDRSHIHPNDLATAHTLAHLTEVLAAWRRNRRRAGTRLRALREAARRSQLELAAASGISHEGISLLEHGRRTPLPQTVRVLAAALGIDPALFVSREQIGLRMLTTAEAAARLEVPVGRVQMWLKQGELAGEKVSGQWRVPAVAVAELERSERLRGRSRRLDPRYRG